MRTIYYTVILFLLPLYMQAQHVIEKRVSVNYNNASLPYILSDLKEKHHINFSYASNLFTSTNKISFKAENAPLREVLKKTLGNNIQYEIKGNIIILRRTMSKHNNIIPSLKHNIKDSLPQATLTKIISDSVSLRKTNLPVVKDEYTTDSLPTKTPPIQISNLNFKPHSATTNKHYVKDYKFTLEGFVNISKERYNKTQIGFLNVARNVKGSQIGFINIARSVSGQQVGIINFSKNYHKVELSTSSSFTGNILYKTGARYFHSIFALGVKAKDDLRTSELGFGYGLGSELEITKKNTLTIDILLYQLKEPNTDLFDKLNLMEQLRINWAYALSPALSVFMGPELCLKTSQHTTYRDNDGDRDDEKKITREHCSENKLRFQPGINVGVRF